MIIVRFGNNPTVRDLCFVFPIGLNKTNEEGQVNRCHYVWFIIIISIVARGCVYFQAEKKLKFHYVSFAFYLLHCQSSFAYSRFQWWWTLITFVRWWKELCVCFRLLCSHLIERFDVVIWISLFIRRFCSIITSIWWNEMKHVWAKFENDNANLIGTSQMFIIRFSTI